MVRRQRSSRPYISAASLLLLVSLIRLSEAAGEPCSTLNDRLDPGSHKFLSDCGVKDYCSTNLSARNTSSIASTSTSANGTVATTRVATTATGTTQTGDQDLDILIAGNDDGTGSVSGNGTVNAGLNNNGGVGETKNGICVPRGCRVDEYPFGYGPEDPLPPLCPPDKFCPDEGDECKLLVPVGGPCQFNRDDQCAPPPNITLFASDTNFNGSICLAGTCKWANGTVGQPCFIDNVVYTGYLPDGSEFTDIVSRDDCSTSSTPTLYCSTNETISTSDGNSGPTCQPTLPVGSPCASDHECSTSNCNVHSICAEAPETPLAIATHVYVLVSLAIVGSMVGIVWGLFVLNDRWRERRRRTLWEYWKEQRDYRRRIMELHSTKVGGVQEGVAAGSRGTTPGSDEKSWIAADSMSVDSRERLLSHHTGDGLRSGTGTGTGTGKRRQGHARTDTFEVILEGKRG